MCGKLKPYTELCTCWEFKDDKIIRKEGDDAHKKLEN
jgi:hypothetical protein